MKKLFTLISFGIMMISPIFGGGVFSTQSNTGVQMKNYYQIDFVFTNSLKNPLFLDQVKDFPEGCMLEIYISKNNTETNRWYGLQDVKKALLEKAIVVPENGGTFSCKIAYPSKYYVSNQNEFQNNDYRPGFLSFTTQPMESIVPIGSFEIAIYPIDMFMDNKGNGSSHIKNSYRNCKNVICFSEELECDGLIYSTTIVPPEKN